MSKHTFVLDGVLEVQSCELTGDSIPSTIRGRERLYRVVAEARLETRIEFVSKQPEIPGTVLFMKLSNVPLEGQSLAEDRN